MSYEYKKHTNTQAFKSSALEVLAAYEVQNYSIINAIEEIRFIEKAGLPDPHRLLATINDSSNNVALIAVCTGQFDVLHLFATDNRPNPLAINYLLTEFKNSDYKFATVRAEEGLSKQFVKAHGGDFKKLFTLAPMLLEDVPPTPKASGYCRLLAEGDLHFAPFWQKACAQECRISSASILGQHLHSLAAIEAQTRYIWDDNGPVAQAHFGAETQNGAFIDDVYTPPFFRNKGYATALVSAVSRKFFENGKKYCALVADTENPTSCGIYRKIGYRDLCVIEEIEHIRS